jgi:hypothetical protein
MGELRYKSMSFSPRNQKEVSVWLHVPASAFRGKESSVHIGQEAGWYAVTVRTFRTGKNILALLGIEPVSLGCPGKMVKTMGVNSAVFCFNICTVHLLLFFVYIHVTVRRNRFLFNDQQDSLIIQIYFVIKLYMFRASSLPIIRSFLLYSRHW